MQVLTELKLVTLVKHSFSSYFEADMRILFSDDDSWTHVKEIPNTKLLVSLHHNWEKPANMAVFDISKKDQIKEIYSLGEVSGRCIIIFYLPLLNNRIFS